MIFTRLEKLALSGDKTAQSLRNGFEGAGKTLENFLQTTQDAVEYLNVSPSKFMPALNSLYKNIQKVDPLTGKLTEQFKKMGAASKRRSDGIWYYLGVKPAPLDAEGAAQDDMPGDDWPF